MKFEGTQVNVPIKGIMRAGTDNLSVDGAMNEVIGMEYKDGSWLPYNTSEADVIIYRPKRTPIEHEWVVMYPYKAYVHKTSDGNSHRIFLESNSNRYLYYETFTEEDTIYTAILSKDVKDVEMVGNMLCVATDDGLKYYLWKDGAYEETNIPYECINRISLRVSAGFTPENDLLAGVTHRAVYTESPAETVANWRIVYDYCRDLIESSVVAALGAVQERGGLTGYVLGCIAYRKKNGMLVGSSAPVLLAPPMAKFNSSSDGYRESRWEGTELTDVFNTLQGGTKKIYEKENRPNTGSAPKHIFYNVWGYEGVEEVYIRQNGSNLCCAYHDQTPAFILQQTEGRPTDELTIYDSYANIPQLASSVTTTSEDTVIRNSNSQSGERDWNIYTYAAGNSFEFLIPDDDFIESLRAADVSSICFFLTEQVSPFKIYEKVEDYYKMFPGGTGAKRVYSYNAITGQYVETDYLSESLFVARKEEREISNELKKLNTFYLVEELDLDTIEETGVWKPINLEGKLGDNLVVREQLPLSSFNDVRTFPNKLSAYNYRLHIFDYSQEFFNGYTYLQYQHNAGIGQYPISSLPITTGQNDAAYSYRWEIEVKIKDNDGETTVAIHDEEAVSTIINNLSPFIVYPDENAQSIKIRLYESSLDPLVNRVYEGEFIFKHDFAMGLSYYISPDLQPITIEHVAELDSETYPSFESDNIERYYSNGLKVSDTAYPSYFPIENTYRIGNERIIAIARLTIPMSQDNYDVNKLILFCTDGIYSLGVDKSGNGAYFDKQYVNPEVCVNEKSVCELGGAIVFASDKGLMMLSGDGVQEFSPQLNGEIRFLPEETGSYVKEGRRIYNKIVTHPHITTLKDSISHDDFIDYLQQEKTVVSYISKKNKLVVYNQNKQYVYIIDIQTRNTTKLNLCFAFDDDNTPEETYWEPEGKYHVFGYRSESGLRDCLIQSRPIKIQEDDKCSYRVVFTGYFEGDSASDKWAELLVLGSLDGDNWRAIGVKERKLNESFHNFGCITERGSWKYLMFIFAGELSPKSHIDSIDITIDGRYNNKKR